MARTKRELRDQLYEARKGKRLGVGIGSLRARSEALLGPIDKWTAEQKWLHATALEDELKHGGRGGWGVEWNKLLDAEVRRRRAARRKPRPKKPKLRVRVRAHWRRLHRRGS